MQMKSKILKKKKKINPSAARIFFLSLPSAFQVQLRRQMARQERLPMLGFATGLPGTSLVRPRAKVKAHDGNSPHQYSAQMCADGAWRTLAWPNYIAAAVRAFALMFISMEIHSSSLCCTLMGSLLPTPFPARKAFSYFLKASAELRAGG